MIERATYTVTAYGEFPDRETLATNLYPGEALIEAIVAIEGGWTSVEIHDGAGVSTDTVNLARALVARLPTTGPLDRR